ncbi:protein ILRUN isoform X2 [Procambarus clarkii]|uniref:protein ILRUN isoform X2 n=1 Tax=Procambarus clarkii TaxID=6728 RepID=UPI001E677A22|nr:protein ILRUN-like isoform X2 [Procambarus clarkii]
MEVDEDLEAGLLRQFNCMLTTDKEVLVKELQTLVGAHLNEHSARFYLEMTDWNLQAAVCAYFDLQSFNKLPQMTFVKDITIGEGESVPPSTRFIKTWRIQNPGEDGWPGGCSLIFTGGEQLGAPSHVNVSSLGAGEVADISVEMTSPSQTGLYSSKWRMTTAQGNFFGETIWVIVQVDSGGTLALMQQMVNLKELGSPPSATRSTPATTFTNPFAPLHLGQLQIQQPPQQQEQQHHMNGNFQSQQPSEISICSPLTHSCQQDPDGDVGMS